MIEKELRKKTEALAKEFPDYYVLVVKKSMTIGELFGRLR